MTSTRYGAYAACTAMLAISSVLRAGALPTLSAALLCDPAAAPHDPYTDATSGAPYRIVREPVCRQGHAIHGGDGAHQTDPWRKRSPSPAPAPFGLAGLGIASSLLSVAPDIVKGAAKVL